MTFKKLRYQIYIVLAILLLVGSIGILIGSIYEIDSKPWQVYKTIIPLVIALPTAWLAFSFQRRNSYLNALRAFWSRLLPIIQNTIAFTRLKDPKKETYSAVVKDLNVIIDDVRSVFKNIDEEKPIYVNGELVTKKGIYPYETLKYICRVLIELNPDNSPTESKRRICRSIIEKVWKDTHLSILQEFDRNVPSFPLSPYSPITNYKHLQKILEEEGSTETKAKDGK